MQLCIRRLACLALLAAACVFETSHGQHNKVTNCCTEVSIADVTAPILGYRIQRKALPCVRAVIFETTEGEVCSHWKQEWVFEKIKELDNIRNAKSSTPVPTSTRS